MIRLINYGFLRRLSQKEIAPKY